MLDPCFWQVTAIIDHQTPQKIDLEAKMRVSVHFTLFLQCHTYQFRPQDFVWHHAILVQFMVGCDLWRTYDWKTTVYGVFPNISHQQLRKLSPPLFFEPHAVFADLKRGLATLFTDLFTDLECRDSGVVGELVRRSWMQSRNFVELNRRSWMENLL